MNLCNPLLISTLTTVFLLMLGNVGYELYYSNAKYLNYLLTPATVC